MNLEFSNFQTSKSSSSSAAPSNTSEGDVQSVDVASVPLPPLHTAESALIKVIDFFFSLHVSTCEVYVKANKQNTTID